MNQTANARQVAGTHYASADGIQHWDLIDEYNVGYLEGCASKYVTRWRKKDGLVALEKAAHFMQKLYERRSAQTFSQVIPRMPGVPLKVIARFAAANDLNAEEERILGHILAWQSTATIDLARREIEALHAANAGHGDDCAEASIGYVNQDRT